MKHLCYFKATLRLLAALCCAALASCSSPSTGEQEQSDFRMMVRLWPVHHNDSTLTDQLIAAFREYDFCDEVWLCSETPATHELSWHAPSARRMGVAARKFRDAGIIPSLQVVALGHGDGAVSFGPIKDTTIHWGTMVGPNGEVTASVNCPRQTAYLKFMEEAYTPYVSEVHPHSLYLDDDLRITSHVPAPFGCFCDTCITLFNRQFGYSFGRESLVGALIANQGGGKVRSDWIAFGQESLAGVVRAISRGVHRVSPETRIGLQHTAFHDQLLEGWDWNPMFRAMKEETGLDPVSRPGHGFYDDHSPRGMISKGLGIARQVRRLEPGITEIAPEIEGYLHKATGKSARSLCLETMYYLSMGATQMSYAIICGNEEPMSWYADHYFKALSQWKPFAREYADFNRGTLPSGIDPFISKSLVLRNVDPGEDPWAWIRTSAGDQAVDLETLGLPFAPEDPRSPVLMLDMEDVRGMGVDELRELLSSRNIVMELGSWNLLGSRGLVQGFVPAEPPSRDCGDYDSPHITPGARYSDLVSTFRFFENSGGAAEATPSSDGGSSGVSRAATDGRQGGCRVAVVPSLGVNLVAGAGFNGAWRLALLHAFDWASGNALPAVLESFAQAAVVPRKDAQGRLRSVAILNCSISPEESYTLRLRTGLHEGDPAPKFVWKKQGCRDQVLHAEKDGEDFLLTVPVLEGWNFGWIAVEL